MQLQSFASKKVVAVGVACLVFVAAAVVLKSESGPADDKPASVAANNDTVELTQDQLKSIKIGAVGMHAFSVDKETVGSISFADDLLVQVFPPYPGRIIRSLVELGINVHRGEPLYTIDSPDLIQAESTLISTSGVYATATRELERARALNRADGGVSQREVDQATSDQQTAEGAMKAARDAVRIFGKTDVEMDQIVASRKVDPALIVRSPIAGQVTAFNAPPGLFVQPGNGTAPYTIAHAAHTSATTTPWCVRKLDKEVLRKALTAR